MASSPASPASGLLDALRPQLARHLPFSEMAGSDVDDFIAHCTLRYFADGETVLSPEAGEVRELLMVREGAIARVPPASEGGGGAIRFDPGDLLPVDAALARRPVLARYDAIGDTFVLALPMDAFVRLCERSAPFKDFLTGRVLALLEGSRRARVAEYSSEVLQEQSLETPLGRLIRTAAVCCTAETTVGKALTEMHERHIGSIVVAGEDGRAQGILTRHDVLGRVTLARVPLDAAIGTVMVHPVHTLPDTQTAHDAAMLMARHGIRHVPVTRDGAVVGMVSERDLFAMQRQSLKGVSTAIHASRSVDDLKAAAAGIRSFASGLLEQGVQARQLTSLVSHLNDVLTTRLLHLAAKEKGISLDTVCWVALGSEGRGEQTVATDQDNALILPDDFSTAQSDAALAFGRFVNAALDKCGYPLCRGGIMAGEPYCCVPLSAWQARFAAWIDRGTPEDLLKASIFFDMRALAGNLALASQLLGPVREAARSTPRFLRQLAINALEHEAPLNWLGGIEADGSGGVDLKLQGTAIFVDAARIYALAQGVPATGTRDRLRTAGARLGAPAGEYEAWVGGFEFLQMLRLRLQIEAARPRESANRVELDSLNDIDRRVLREALSMARRLQQRLRLDYDR